MSNRPERISPSPTIGQVYADLSPDLWPRVPRPVSYGRPAEIDRYKAPPYVGDAIYLTRSLLGRKVIVGTTPTLIVDSPVAWPYLILNPSKTTGLTTTVTGFSGTVTGAGDSVTSPGPIGVAGYYAAHLHLIVTAVTGAWDIISMSYDAITTQWTDTQTVFSAIGTTGNYYASIGTFGVATDLAFRWNPVSAGSITFSLGVVLKGGLGGSTGGLAQVVYLGPEGVTTSSGYPLLEGHKQAFIIPEGVQLWGVAGTNIEIRVFML